MPTDWTFCTGIALLTGYFVPKISPLTTGRPPTEHFVLDYPYWLNILYWNNQQLQIARNFCRGAAGRRCAQTPPMPHSGVQQVLYPGLPPPRLSTMAQPLQPPQLQLPTTTTSTTNTTPSITTSTKKRSTTKNSSAITLTNTRSPTKTSTTQTSTIATATTTSIT